MMKFIVVDSDTKSAQSIIQGTKTIPSLELSGRYTDPKKALDSLREKPVDLIFLNIGKRVMRGTAEYEMFRQQALVIVLSVHPKFAFDAFEHNAIDFLIKPLIMERLEESIEKANRLRPVRESWDETWRMPSRGRFIFIKEGTRLVRIELDDILFVMGLRNYVSIFTKTQKVVTLQTMKEMEEMLPANRFYRVHRSYLVAIDKINSIEKQQIHLDDRIIPIGNNYFPAFMKTLQSQ